MSGLGHKPTFATPLRHVWNVAVNRHSAPNVGNALKNGPSGAGMRRSGLCQNATLASEVIRIVPKFAPIIKIRYIASILWFPSRPLKGRDPCDFDTRSSAWPSSCPARRIAPTWPMGNRPRSSRLSTVPRPYSRLVRADEEGIGALSRHRAHAHHGATRSSGGQSCGRTAVTR